MHNPPRWFTASFSGAWLGFPLGVHGMVALGLLFGWAGLFLFRDQWKV